MSSRSLHCDDEIQWQTAHMHFTVSVHLKRFEDAFEWSLKFFRAVWCKCLLSSSSTILLFGETSTQNNEIDIDGKDQLLSVVKETFRIITRKDGSIYEFSLPKLYSFVNEIKSDQQKNIDHRCVKNVRWFVSTCTELLSNLRVSYGAYCIKKLNVSDRFNFDKYV